MKQLLIQTKKIKEIVDLTDLINSELSRLTTTPGFCVLFIKHTTAALTTADLDMGTDLDTLDAIQAMIPKLRYRHPHNPQHVTDHIASSLIGPSLIVPIKNNQLDLGTWQKIILVELNGPREREISLAFLAEFV